MRNKLDNVEANKLMELQNNLKEYMAEVLNSRTDIDDIIDLAVDMDYSLQILKEELDDEKEKAIEEIPNNIANELINNPF